MVSYILEIVLVSEDTLSIKRQRNEPPRGKTNTVVFEQV